MSAKQPFNLLIVKLTSMGDVLHVLPALTDLQRAYPNIQVDWLVEDSFSEIPTWHPSVNEVIKVSTRRWRRFNRESWQPFFAFRKQLRSKRYDMVLDAQGLIKSAALARMARLTKQGKRVGFSGSSLKESPAAWFYQFHVAVERQQHAIDRVRQLFAGALEYELSSQSVEYQISQAIPDQRFIASPYIVLLHGTTWATKHLPDIYWRELADLAAQSGYKVALVWGNDAEKQRADWIAEASDSVQVLPKLSLLEVASILKQAQGVVAVDTGLGHLSAALRVPCVSVYGATNAALTGAVGDKQAHIQTDYACSPCLRKQCDKLSPNVIDMPCYKTVSSSSIWAKLLGLME